MEIATFADRLMARFPDSVSGQMFIQMQSDPELMREYQALVREHGVAEVTRGIGQRVRDHMAYREDHGEGRSVAGLREALS